MSTCTTVSSCRGTSQKVIIAKNGHTNAGTLGLKNPGVSLDFLSFANEVLTPQKHELCNRPEVGVSMLACSLMGFLANLQEGAQIGLFNEMFVDSVRALFLAHDVAGIDRMLNVHGHPNEQRTQEDIGDAVTRLLNLGIAVAAKWNVFSDFFARSATSFVGCHALLVIGAITAPGAYANGVRDIPLQDPAVLAARTTLLNGAALGSNVANFIGAAVVQRAQVCRSWGGGATLVTAAVAAGAPNRMLSCAVSERPPPASQIQEKKVDKLWNKLNAYEAGNEEHTEQDVMDQVGELLGALGEIVALRPSWTHAATPESVLAKGEKLTMALRTRKRSRKSTGVRQALASSVLVVSDGGSRAGSGLAS